jgi:hypothetical protein
MLLSIETITPAMIAAPSSSKTIDTVVDVGSPKELKMSRSKMSVSITAKKIIKSTSSVKKLGLKMPFRAISMIPLENKEPRIIPHAAIIMIVLNEATLLPIAEFRKFTASLLTPTIKSITAKTSNTPTIKSKIFISQF